MPPSPRYTVRLPPALDALVQARVQAGTPFAVLIREALSAYLDSIGFFIFVFDMQAVPSHMGTVNRATDTYSSRLPTGRMACGESPEVL